MERCAWWAIDVVKSDVIQDVSVSVFLSMPSSSGWWVLGGPAEALAEGDSCWAGQMLLVLLNKESYIHAFQYFFSPSFLEHLRQSLVFKFISVIFHK